MNFKNPAWYSELAVGVVAKDSPRGRDRPCGPWLLRELHAIDALLLYKEQNPVFLGEVSALDAGASDLFGVIFRVSRKPRWLPFSLWRYVVFARFLISLSRKREMAAIRLSLAAYQREHFNVSKSKEN